MNCVFPSVGDIVVLDDSEQPRGLLVCNVSKENLRFEKVSNPERAKEKRFLYNWVINGEAVPHFFSEEASVTNGMDQLNQILQRIKTILNCSLENVSIFSDYDEEDGFFTVVPLTIPSERSFNCLECFEKEECQQFRKSDNFAQMSNELKKFIQEELFTTKSFADWVKTL